MTLANHTIASASGASLVRNIIADVSESNQVRSSVHIVSSCGHRFAPDPLIFDDENGRMRLAPMASFANERSCEQAVLFFSQGVKETQLVRAMRWRDVESQHAPAEIATAEEIGQGRAGVL